jgi:hypothetical protein
MKFLLIYFAIGIVIAAICISAVWLLPNEKRFEEEVRDKVATLKGVLTVLAQAAILWPILLISIPFTRSKL